MKKKNTKSITYVSDHRTFSNDFFSKVPGRMYNKTSFTGFAKCNCTCNKSPNFAQCALV